MVGAPLGLRITELRRDARRAASPGTCIRTRPYERPEAVLCACNWTEIAPYLPGALPALGRPRSKTRPRDHWSNYNNVVCSTSAPGWLHMAGFICSEKERCQDFVLRLLANRMVKKMHRHGRRGGGGTETWNGGRQEPHCRPRVVAAAVPRTYATMKSFFSTKLNSVNRLDSTF